MGETVGSMTHEQALSHAENGTAVFCSFCGKHQAYVALLVAGPKVFICDECVDICAASVAEKRNAALQSKHQEPE